MNSLTREQPTKEFTESLSKFSGVVVEWTFWRFESENEPSVDTLRQVVRATCRNAWLDEHNVIDDVALKAASPVRVDWLSFLGHDLLRPFGSNSSLDEHSGFLHAFAYPPFNADCPVVASVSKWKRFVSGIEPTVKRLGPATPEFQQNFKQVLQSAFGTDIRDPRIQFWEWPTNWSTYFDAGHEWWGSFCWSVVTPDRRIVGIVASTTD